jgi:hypothetical protein
MKTPWSARLWVHLRASWKVQMGDLAHFSVSSFCLSYPPIIPAFPQSADRLIFASLSDSFWTFADLIVEGVVKFFVIGRYGFIVSNGLGDIYFTAAAVSQPLSMLLPGAPVKFTLTRNDFGFVAKTVTIGTSPPPTDEMADFPRSTFDEKVRSHLTDMYVIIEHHRYMKVIVNGNVLMMFLQVPSR